MEPDFERQEAIVQAAFLLGSVERAAFLDAVCAGDPGFRVEIEKRIARSDAATQPDPTPIPKTSPNPHAAAATASEEIGQMIGRYKLREKIGEGGCGVVYVADQEEPVRRRVALKVIKLGMDTKQVVARFEAERQALTMMDHPNIAKALEAGSTESGRPYFVMELVRGVRITEYCDTHELSTKQRLELFVQVCHAVQHAHQKGIIHRDIKPSNVLVTLQDGAPVPKVIDFGISKATEGRLTDLTVYTELHQFIGTPAYMSPEQAEMSGLDVDTRSDIYSLGVLLYELLTGKTPFDARELIQAGMDEMRRTIREKEPARPSTKLASLTPDEQTTTAKRRSSDAPKLIHSLKGDLDWIVLKSIEKDRTRRYETANGLAMDIHRYLRNEAVLARPPSAVYRFQKSFRRNTLAFCAAAAVTVALLAGLIATRRQVVRAVRAENLSNQRLKEVTAERDAKEEARSEAEEVLKFLEEVFQSPDPSRNGRMITVAETLDRAVTRLDVGLKDQGERQARLRASLARTYSGLGLAAKAIPLQENARDYWVAKYGLENTNTLAAMHDLGNSLDIAGRGGEALKIREEVFPLRRKILGPEHPDTLRSMRSLAISFGKGGRGPEGAKLFYEILDLSRKVNGPVHPDTLLAMHNVAIVLRSDGRFEESLKMREEVFALNRKESGLEHPRTLLAMGNLANSLVDAGRLAEALKLREELLVLSRKVYGPEHHQTLLAMSNQADTFQELGRREEALKLREEVLALNRRVNGAEHPDTLSAMTGLASSVGATGALDDALKRRQEVLAISRRVNGPEHPDTLRAMQRVALNLADVGRPDEAIGISTNVLSSCEKLLGPEDRHTLLAMDTLADFLAQAGRSAEAIKMREELLVRHRKANGPEDRRTMLATHKLAAVCFRANQSQAGREALSGLPKTPALRQWLVLAPIPYNGFNGAKALDQEQIPDLAALRPRAGERLKIGSDVYAWQAYQTGDFVLDFEMILGKRIEFAVGYAACYLVTDTEQKGLLLSVSSDDQAKVYVNGKELYSYKGNRGMESEDKIEGVELRPGANLLIVKFVNERGDWQGSISLSAANGHPVERVRATLDPDDKQ